MISVQEISAVTAACMMVKKSDFDAVGGLDETFQVAFNDIDLCMKFRAAGKKIILHRMQNCITMNQNQEDWKIHRKNSSALTKK